MTVLASVAFAIGRDCSLPLGTHAQIFSFIVIAKAVVSQLCTNVFPHLFTTHVPF